MYKRDEERYANLTLRRRVLLRDHFFCRYCGVKVTMYNAHLDHVLPWSKGGRTWFDNLVTSCAACNLFYSDARKKRPASNSGKRLDRFMDWNEYHRSGGPEPHSALGLPHHAMYPKERRLGMLERQELRMRRERIQREEIENIEAALINERLDQEFRQALDAEGS